MFLQIVVVVVLNQCKKDPFLVSSKQPAPLPPNQLVNTNKSTAATTNLELTT